MTRIPATIALFLASVSVLLAQKADPVKGPIAAEFEKLLPGIGKGQSKPLHDWQAICFRASAPGNDALRLEACKLMSGRLGPSEPKTVRLWFLKQLERIGREESVEAIAAVIGDADEVIRDAAIRALANNPSPTATRKLTEALGTVSAQSKVGVINALGYRADPAAVESLAKELNNGPVAIAAARALGRIPSPAAIEALTMARAKASGDSRREIADAQLAHANRALNEGNLASAARIYKALNTSEEARSIQLAALRGTILTSGEAGGAIILDTLRGNDRAAHQIALGTIPLQPVTTLKSLADKMDQLPVPSRVALIEAIAGRGDKALGPIVLAAAQSSEPAVRQAGVRGLALVGDASCVEFLLNMLPKDPLAVDASHSLSQLAADGINAKVLSLLEKEMEPERTVLLIGILKSRQANESIPTLLKLVANSNASVRATAINGLRDLASREDIRALVETMLRLEDAKEREGLELAIVRASEGIPVEKRAGAILSAIGADNPTRKAIILPLLGRLGGPQSLQYLRESMKSSDPALQRAARAGFLHWSDLSANEDLLMMAAKPVSDAERLQILQALVRINTAVVDRAPEEKTASFEALKKAMSLAANTDERRLILDRIGFVRNRETLAFVMPYLENAELQQSACRAVIELAHSKNLRKPNREIFDQALTRVIAVCKDKGLVERAKQYKADR